MNMDINLLPWRLKRRQKERTLFYGVFATALTFSIITIFLWNNHLKNAVTQETILDKKLNPYPFIKNSLRIKLSRILKNRNILPLLTHIINSMPKECLLTQIKFQKNIWKIAGLADNTKTVLLFMERLKKTNIFNNLSILHLEQKKHVLFILQLPMAN